MRTFFISLLSFIFLAPTLIAQDLGQLRKQMRPVEGSEFTMGGGYSYTLRGHSMEYIAPEGFDEAIADGMLIGEVPPENNAGQQVKVEPFLISAKEVTNLEYRAYLVDLALNEVEEEEFWNRLSRLEKQDMKLAKQHWAKLFEKADRLGALPEEECWTVDFPFAYNKPLADNYFWHGAFDSYPVVGVTWQQARDYCAWLTRANNAERIQHGLQAQPDFRLPTEAEWECAARGIVQNTEDKPRIRAVYPWKGTLVHNAKGDFRANIKVDQRNYIGDNFEYTAPVGSYDANDFGLFDMAGNVAEWTEDVAGMDAGTLKPADKLLSHVSKGGSWADYKYGAMVGSRCFVSPSQGYSRIGFRVAQSQ